MPNDIVPAPAIAYGGTWVFEGDPSPRAVAAYDNATIQPGGVDWVGETPRCSRTTKSGRACLSPPIDGFDFCIGHQRQEAAASKKV